MTTHGYNTLQKLRQKIIYLICVVYQIQDVNHRI